MIYNIDNLSKDFTKKFNIKDFKYMKSVKDLVVYFIAHIKNTKPIIIKLNKDIELNYYEYLKLKKYVYMASVKNIPIEYITGFTYIYGRKFLVNNNTLIPRQDTETLIEETLKIIKENRSINILDLCTGTGVIGITTYLEIKNINVTLLDIFKGALVVAKNNLKMYNIEDVNIVNSDLFENIDLNNKFDVIVSNPPYLTKQEMKNIDKNVKYEPAIALFGGDDGLDIYRRIISNAYLYMTDNSYLLLEIGMKQAKDIIEIIKRQGIYKDSYIVKDINGKDRVIVCHFQKK